MNLYFQIEDFPAYFVNRQGDILGPHGDIAQYTRPDKYKSVRLYRTVDGKSEKKGMLIHRIVATSFIANPEPQKWNIVNHKNGNVGDNNAENLEWCDYKFNSHHARDNGAIKITKKPCDQYTLSGEFVKSFDSVKQAAEETGYSYTGIAKACKNPNLSSGKFKWEYTSEIKKLPSDIIRWRNIDEFPDYKISRSGEIYSQNRKMMMSSHNKGGFLTIKLFVEAKAFVRKVHRLVADTYIPNPKNYPNVIHKNNDKHDNNVENLEWCTSTVSTQHAVNTGIIPPPKGKSVMLLNKDGTDKKKFNTIKEASEETGAPADTITLVCKGKRQKSGGYKWRWVD